MTGPEPQPAVPRLTSNAPFDVGNELLAIVPVSLTTSTQTTPAGKRACTTVRTVDTTLTVFLDADEIQQWIDVLTHSKRELSGLIVPGSSTLL